MPRPLASAGRDTRREILDAALELFAAEGFHGTGLREIARAVGVREGAIYHHFPSKEALLDAVLEEPFGRPDLPVKQLPSALLSDPAAALEAAANGMLELFGTLRENKRFRIMLADGARLAAAGRLDFFAKTAPAREALRKTFETLVASGRFRDADPEFLMLEFIGPLVMWRILGLILPRHRFVTDPKKYVRWHVQQFVAGATAGTAAPHAPKP